MRKAMHNKKHILGIVGACLFTLIITLLLPGTATAVQNVENTYARPNGKTALDAPIADERKNGLMVTNINVSNVGVKPV